MTLENCSTIDKMTQVIIVRVRTPGVENASHPQRLGVTRVRTWALGSSWCWILECSRTPYSKIWARGYGNLTGVLSKDITLGQQSLGSGAWDCQGLNNNDFFNTCQNGAVEGQSTLLQRINIDAMVFC